MLIFTNQLLAQKETKVDAPIKKVTVFKQGAQVEHQKQVSLQEGKQVVVFQKLTDFFDPSSLQLKCSPEATILSVKPRKNYDDKSIAEAELEEKNTRKKELEAQERKLRDEYKVLLYDEQLLMKNNELGSQQVGVKISELKEASLFFHTKLTEINTRKSHLDKEIELVVRKINTIKQEINTRKSLPVIIYTEIEVELDVKSAATVNFDFTYVTDKASWKPYYDMRSNGVGEKMMLEAKGLISQNTGIEWKNVKLVLSTNDPYDNTEEPVIDPWYLNYNSPLPQRNAVTRYSPTYSFDGETIYGEVTDAVSGEPLPFARISLTNYPQKIVTTDVTGKFSFQVPKGEYSYTVSYLGYRSQYMNINSPFTKILLYPETVAMETISGGEYPVSGSYSTDDYKAAELMETEVSDYSPKKKIVAKKERSYAYNTPAADAEYGLNSSIATVEQKDLRMEFVINTPFTIPSGEAEQRVSIANYQLEAQYEYHSVPKFEASAYMVSKVSGWEKHHLLSGDANIYFNGTFIGKNYIDVNTAMDTLQFSLGKDKNVVIERKRSDEMMKIKSVGNRYKYEVTWNFTVRNNGASNAPIIVKDQFPISVNDDIKVKQGLYTGAVLDEKTGILTWKFPLNKGESKKFSFDFQVDYGKSGRVNLE